MNFIQVSREQATQFLNLVERYQMGEITRHCLRRNLRLISDGKQEHLWGLFLARFDEIQEDTPQAHC